ncbi:hypothetical protein FJU30_06500 [Affinibrenneria salicis]|uniref:Uncharacterized protein n=1 Tax=Affinibrenneria salicis TaxID=2590031 RepID=A0A5J5G4X6_9GAMM|nr:hypothetical protein FJU30_06500 [Affinibrenneria salicis]
MVKQKKYFQPIDLDKNFCILMMLLIINTLLFNTGVVKTGTNILIGMLVAVNFVPPMVNVKKLWFYRTVVALCSVLLLISVYRFFK